MREAVIFTGNRKSARDRVTCCSSVSLRGRGRWRSVAGALQSGLAQKAVSLPPDPTCMGRPFPREACDYRVATFLLLCHL